MSRTFCAALAVLSVAALVSVVVADDKKAGAKVAPAEALDRLKGMAGEWKSSGGGEHDDGGKKVVYRVISGGTTVMETLMPGSKHEMVSMYHLDGNDLKMTHYCAVGNQPRMKFDQTASSPDRYVFVFDGGTNFDPSTDMHIHGVTFTFKGKDSVVADWEGYEKGKKSGTTSFKMTRP
jgi:hypothetical protein